MSSGIGAMWNLVNFALSIGMVGGLVDLVVDMRHLAWHADHAGIVSMRSLTQQLMYPDDTIQHLRGIKRSHRSSNTDH